MAGQELILNWKATKPDKDDKVVRKNAFDQIAYADKKGRKAKAKATASNAVPQSTVVEFLTAGFAKCSRFVVVESS